ncbi:base excision dna repair [Fusarium sp. NRRL 25303]|nr:base excision dna repair [Fusarium sp. NRRL 25303]
MAYVRRPVTRAITRKSSISRQSQQTISKRPTTTSKIKRQTKNKDHEEISAPDESRQPHKAATTVSLSEKKLASWSRHSASSPFPDFYHPTSKECQVVHSLLQDMHGDAVKENFAQGDEPVADGQYTSVMDALVVAALSQATSWKNAKRAMNHMKQVYGSTFAYDAIVEGGIDKLREALRPGGMQNRKSKILMGLLKDVKSRHGRWDLQFLFSSSDEEVTKEVVSYWGLGPKCAHCLMSICLKRDRFAVDTHIYRLSGLWGWRPRDAGIGKVQAHLDHRIPNEIKFALHYEMIVHGRECRACAGGDKKAEECPIRRALYKL